MRKTSLPWVLALLAPLLPPFSAAGFCGGSPFVQARVDEAAKKKRDREDKPKDTSKPSPNPNPPVRVESERPRSSSSNSGIDPNPGVRRDRDRDRNEDQVRHRDRDRDDYNRNRNRNPVIVNRPVYVPIYPSTSYPYPYPYSDPVGNREDALLEATGKQMRFALRENEILKPFNLDTDTVGDSIEIHGAVDTIEHLQVALDVARNINPKTRIVVMRIRIRQR